MSVDLHRIHDARSVPASSLAAVAGRSPVNGVWLILALAAHAAEIREQQEARDRMARVAAAAPEARGHRASRYLVNANVADLTGRRHGRVRGLLSGGVVVVRWEDTGHRENVHEDLLRSRYTVQSVGFVPKSERDAAKAREEQEEEVA